MYFRFGLICLLTAASLFAQSSTGTATMIGAVSDSTGSVVPGAKVTVTNKDAGFTNQPPVYTNCVLAHTAILAGYTTKTVARITPACTLTFSGDTVALKEDLVIMADGPITFANNNTVQSSSSAAHTIYLIEPTNGITNPNCAATNRNISVSNQTNFVGVYTFAYTQCTLTWQNNNDGLGGQMIGGTVNITNLYDMSFVPIIIPTGVVTGFKEDLAFKREIVNP